MSKFQLVLTGIFGILILIGVFVFAFARPNSTPQVPVLVWGSLSESEFASVLSNLPLAKDRTVSVQYVQKRDSEFDRDFVEALAAGVGPDVVMLPQDSIVTHEKKLFVVPYDSYSERLFKDVYIEEGELLLTRTGILGFPFLIDPLVMYYNRDVLTANAIAKPPLFWDQFFELSKQLTQKDGALNVSRATVSLGEFQNVTNSKEIIATLMMQAGNTLFVRNNDGTYSSTIAGGFGQPVPPAISAINFYTEFSNPLKTSYSWNRSLPDSQLMFTSGDLVFYFGFASELQTLKQKNPNLNFDVTTLPQVRSTDNRATFGRMKALAITKNSKNPNAAFTVIAGLSSVEGIKRFAEISGLPPVRRDLLSQNPNDPNMAVFYRSALWTKAWLDPNRVASANIFRTMIESVTGGRARPTEAVDTADQSLGSLIRNY